MKLAFVTMVWRDYWLLEKWVSHNSQYVDKRSLYVLNHGGDPKIDAIATGCNVIHVPREELTIDLDRRRWDLLGGVTNGLLAFHDRVICTDVDELIVYTGKGSLQDHLAASAVETVAVSPVGLNLIPSEGEADLTKGVLNAHPQAILSAKYTKPCIVKSRVVYTIGGHGLVRGRFTIDPELLLFHLHYVTPDYAQRMAERQDIVAQSVAHNEASGTPANVGKRFWINWSDPAMIREKEFAHFARAAEVAVEDGFEECARILNGAIKSEGKKVVVDHAIMAKAPRRVTIPPALRTYL
ncbi:hypothetical protein [Thalassovita sp.]|uniref:hypothetical protein n=1 Tax=Thalassovita sp. TaxID=1979401 RepID=UPI0029DE5AB9|nr:hypothetical protein [Thalassovita sp.]